jgi:cob(I)alamin adenosyltransferase
MAPEWQAATGALILVVTLGGPTMFARICIMRALNRRVERAFNSAGKRTKWGRRRLARDR